MKRKRMPKVALRDPSTVPPVESTLKYIQSRAHDQGYWIRKPLRLITSDEAGKLMYFLENDTGEVPDYLHGIIEK